MDISIKDLVNGYENIKMKDFNLFDYKVKKNIPPMVDEWNKEMGGCYLFYDKDFNVLYIGQTISFRDRFYSHARGNSGMYMPDEEKHLIKHAALIIIRGKRRMIDLEGQLIKRIKPKYNVTYMLSEGIGYKKYFANSDREVIYTKKVI